MLEHSRQDDEGREGHLLPLLKLQAVELLYALKLVLLARLVLQRSVVFILRPHKLNKLDDTRSKA